MMRILLCQIDGKLPNLALMRIAAHHKNLGHEIQVSHGLQFERGLWDKYDRVYASAIFRKSIPLMERLRSVYPDAIIGGTGIDPARPGEIVPLSPVIQTEVTAIERHGIATNECWYDPWPTFRQSLGFTQRGCRLKCAFCCVPVKEGKVQAVGNIAEIWRGDPWPREILLLDNDFFGQPDWRGRITELREGGFKVSFNQGINARCLTEEAAQAIASLEYRDDSMQTKRIYTAWDNLKDEKVLFEGLQRLVNHGVKPDSIMVYIIIGFWPGEDHAARDYRRARLREFGCRPYPMPYLRTPELVGFQRWIIGAYDKPSKDWPDGVPWEEWVRAKYQPANLKRPNEAGRLFS